MIIITPNAVPKTVGHDVPAVGNVGCAVALAVAATVALDVAVEVATGQVQSVSDRHWVFLQLPVVDPLAM